MHEKSLKFDLHEDQLASYQEAKDEVASLRNDAQEWRAEHANLEAKEKNLLDEMRDTINSMGKEICHLQNTSNQIQEYIKWLEKDERFAYNGKHISDTKNKQRTMKAILTRAETALKEPLLNIDLYHVIVYELHLLLRVMDVMLDSIITEVIEWDKSDDLDKTYKEPRGISLKKIRS